MAQLMDGKQTALALREQIKAQTSELIAKYHIIPHLVVLLIGDNAASMSYVRGKELACQKAGIKSTIIKKEETISQAEVLDIIHQLNQDNSVHGILLQLPIPKHLNSDFIINQISPSKDVDGFTWTNVAKLSNGFPHLVPCTPLGVMRLLQTYQVSILGKRAVVIGRSQIVGKPMAALLLKDHATVTICHSKTADLRAVCKEADILIAAIGVPNMIDSSYVKPGATVIDVGISKVDGVIKGDVDYDSVFPIAAYLTPVPGGVGPMTIACLLENTLTCYRDLVGV